VFEYKVKVVRVKDGDSIIVDVDLGFGITFKGLDIRLARIDAYETRLGRGTTPKMKAKGLEAKVWLKSQVYSNPAADISIRTTKIKKGKYGRYIAELFINETNINDALVSLGYAVFKSY